MAEYELVMVARAVKKGDGFTEAAKDVDQLNKKVKESGQGAENFGKKLNGVLEGVQKGFGAALGAAVTFKKAFDYSREGAELNQLTDSFELLNKNVLQTPDLLDDMRRAAGGTIKDTDLMAGVLKLAAGATGEYAQTLANISPQLLEIARASNKLNPSLGDTAFLYESLTTAAKRQSVPIADNLGLIIKMDDAVKKVHPSLQNLASSYDQLTDQQKFLNELLFQGGNLIDQVGGDVNSQADAWARLEVQVGTAVDRVKQFAAVRLEPVVSGAVNVIDQLGQAHRDLDEAVARGIITDRQKQAIITSLTTGHFKDYKESLIVVQTALNSYRENVALTTEELAALAPAIKEATGADKKYTQEADLAAEKLRKQAEAMRDVNRILGVHSPIIAKDTRELEEMAYASGELGGAQDRLTQYIAEDKAALEAQTKAIEESIARKEENARVTAELAAAEGDYFTAAIESGDALSEAMQNVGKQTAFVSNLTDAQASDLTRMQTAYDKAAQTIRDYELGVKGANLTDDARNKKIEEQQAIMATLTANMQPLIDAGGQYVEYGAAAVDITAILAKELYESADAAGADAQQLAGLLSLTGEYTKAQINAGLQAAARKALEAELGAAIAAGTITVGEAIAKLEDFSQTWTATTEIETSAALSRLEEIIKKAEAFGNSVTRHKVVIETEGSVPSSTGGSSGGGGKTSDAKTGEADYDPNKKHAAGTGGWLTVPPGFPNDTYTVGLSSHEKYAVVPSGVGMASALGGGGAAVMGGNTYIDRRTTVINANTREAAALAMATVAERRRKNLDTYMGVG